MSETTSPLHDLLPAQVYRELKYKLRKNLPEPPTGDPADVERRLHSAIAEIAAYAPAGAAELNLARRYVEAAEAADECLRLAHEAAGEKSPDAMKLRAQSASFMRQAQGYHARLLRLQNERRKLEKDSQAASRAAWTEHCTIGLLTDDELSPSPCEPRLGKADSTPTHQSQADGAQGRLDTRFSVSCTAKRDDDETILLKDASGANRDDTQIVSSEEPTSLSQRTETTMRPPPDSPSPCGRGLGGGGLARASTQHAPPHLLTIQEGAPQWPRPRIS